MSLPKSVIKFNKDGVTFTSNVDQVNYSLKELQRAALRDVGKYICRIFRKLYYGTFKRRKGNVGRFTQYWVRRKECDLQVGIKPNGFYGLYQEIGSSRQPKLGLLHKAVEDNIAEIIRIESKYLSALESEADTLAKISGGDNGENTEA